MARNQKKADVEFAIAEGGGVKVLERRVYTDKDEYIFYDICISNTVILKDCKLVVGKNGKFISTPSKKIGENFYPQAYISDATQDAILKLIEDDNAWNDTNITYLEFEKEIWKNPDEKKSRRRSARR